jgi:hypothetical protein
MFNRVKITLISWFIFTLSGAWIDRLDHFHNGYFYLKNKNHIEKILQEMAAYRHNGLISQLDKDMGDTLQRTGSYYTLLHFLGAEYDDQGRTLLDGYTQDMNELTYNNGIYRRSNDPQYWGFNPNNCSRDQIFAAQAAIVTYRDFPRGRDLFKQFFKRGFLNQNSRHNWAYPWDANYKWKIPDIPTPSQLSLLLRGLGNRLVYPLVFILDVFIIADIQFFRRLDSRQLWDFDIKILPALIAANSYLPTIWSRWGLSLYLRNHQDIVQRIQHYNQKEFNGIQPLADLYDLSLAKMKDQFVPTTESLGVPVSQRTGDRQISSEHDN